MPWNRRSRLLRRQRAMIFSRSAGTPSATSLGGVGSLCRINVSVDSFDSPGNARCPVTISYSTTPNAKMSERVSSFLPSACSGDM